MFSDNGIDPIKEFFESESARYPTPMPSFNVEDFIMKITESEYDLHQLQEENGEAEDDEKEYIVKQNIHKLPPSPNLQSTSEDDVFIKMSKAQSSLQQQKCPTLTFPSVLPGRSSALSNIGFPNSSFNGNIQFLPPPMQMNQDATVNNVPPAAAFSTLPSFIMRYKMGYSAKIGGFGIANGQFTEPSGIAVTAEGDVVVADTNNHRIQVFDPNCVFKYSFGEPGKHDGQMLYPNRVAISPVNGDFVITERSPTHQVQVFDRFGKFIRKFGTSILQHPRGVCVDSEGRIIIVECKLMRVCIFSSTGDFLHKFSAVSHLMFPNNICVGPNNELFICDNRAHQVKVFNYNGDYLRSIGGEGITNYPISVSINEMGHILVVDNHNKFNLTVFDYDGKILTAFESRVRHSHCFDAAIYNGIVIVASKDYKIYYYHYLNNISDGHQVHVPVLKILTNEFEKKECDEFPPPCSPFLPKYTNELLPKCAEQDCPEKEQPKLDRISSTQNSSSSGDVEENLEVMDFSVPPPPVAIYHPALFRFPMGYTAKIGGFGIADGQFSEPSGIAFTAEGNIVVADTNNHRIQVFDPNCVFKYSFGEPGKRDGQMLYPNRVAVSPLNGDFVITERSPTHQVQVFDRFGRFIRKFGTSILQHPRGVCVDSEGRIIIIECKLMRVCIFSSTGAFLHKFSAVSHLIFPNNICVGPNNELFICDNRAHQIKVFSYNGDYLRAIGGEGITNYPVSVSINRMGHTVVADNHNKFNLTVFDHAGNVLAAFESRVRHSHCLDVAIYNGVVIFASKDYKIYYYRYESCVPVGHRHIHIPVLRTPTVVKKECIEAPSPVLPVAESAIQEFTESKFDRLSSVRNSSSSDDEENDLELMDSPIPPPPFFSQASSPARFPEGSS